jgi:hypothetical protein
VRTACPQCGAAVRPAAPWCTQCYFDLRPAPAPEPPAVRPSARLTAPPPAAAYGAPAPDPLTAPLAVLTGEHPVPAEADPQPTWPCVQCETQNGFELSACSACGAGFLQGAVTDEVSLVIPGVGDLAQMSRNRAMGLAFAGIGVVMLLVLAVGVLLG